MVPAVKKQAGRGARGVARGVAGCLLNWSSQLSYYTSEALELAIRQRFRPWEECNKGKHPQWVASIAI